MKLNKIFTSHMVFAANKTIKIYGEGSGIAKITFAGITKSVSSDENKWIVEFDPMTYGGPYELKAVFPDSEIVLDDIYIGEVYLFAGQSNMQFKLCESKTPKDKYITNNALRLFSTDRIEKNEHFTANDGWITAKADEVSYWSALAYLAGNEISQAKNITVGVISCYQGASIIESWVPEGTFEKMGINIPNDKKTFDHNNEAYSEWNQEGKLYEYALGQVVPFSLSGVVWYQGESDTSADEAPVYGDELCAMINIWRKDFGEIALPFTVVQIADLDNSDDAWPVLQKAQLAACEKLDNVQAVISKDVCETNDIHPPTKEKLAKRISASLM